MLGGDHIKWNALLGNRDGRLKRFGIQIPVGRDQLEFHSPQDQIFSSHRRALPAKKLKKRRSIQQTAGRLRKDSQKICVHSIDWCAVVFHRQPARERVFVKDPLPIGYWLSPSRNFTSTARFWIASLLPPLSFCLHIFA